MKSKTAYPSDGPSMDRKWQIEADERRLTEAAEVVADRARLKAALRCMRQKQGAISKLTSVLSSRRA